MSTLIKTFYIKNLMSYAWLNTFLSYSGMDRFCSVKKFHLRGATKTSLI